MKKEKVKTKMSVGYYCPDWISKGKWREAKAVIEQYEELKAEYRDIIEGSSVEHQEGGRSGNISDPTAQRAIKAGKVKEKIDAIEKAQCVIEPEYVSGVMRYLMYKEKFPDNAGERTYRRKVHKYVLAVAEILHIA